jgi:hypothetical protein
MLHKVMRTLFEYSGVSLHVRRRAVAHCRSERRLEFRVQLMELLDRHPENELVAVLARLEQVTALDEDQRSSGRYDRGRPVGDQPGRLRGCPPTGRIATSPQPARGRR